MVKNLILAISFGFKLNSNLNLYRMFSFYGYIKLQLLLKASRTDLVDLNTLNLGRD